MSSPEKCPQCASENIYNDGNLWVCAECFYEWNPEQMVPSESPEESHVIKDASGNVLADGDTVTVIKDLKIKGSSSVVKVGTKVKNIRLVLDSGDGHDIACKIEGFGAMNLKSEFVRKV